MLRKRLGVTLLEILLVLAISSAVMVMFIGFVQQKSDELRRTRTGLQMQQVLNAGLAYYVSNAKWPASLATLQGTYLPPAGVTFNNAWGQSYKTYANVIPGSISLFYVYTNAVTAANAQLIAGKLPMSFIASAAGATATPPSPTTGTDCTTLPINGACTYVVSAVNIPGQNLNNATAVTFAGLYHSGACVPAPQCPVDSSGNPMSQEIYVVPSSVSGVNDSPVSCASSTDFRTCTMNGYPVTSYTAYAVGKNAPGTGVTDSLPATIAGGSKMNTCTGVPAQDFCYSQTGTKIANGQYWRVCLSVTTEKGTVVINQADPNKVAWGGSMGSILAITRCAPANESKGSDFFVWGE